MDLGQHPEVRFLVLPQCREGRPRNVACRTTCSRRAFVETTQASILASMIDSDIAVSQIPLLAELGCRGQASGQRRRFI